MNTATLRVLSMPVSRLPRSGPIVRRLAPRDGPVARQQFRCGATFDLDLSDRIQAESFIRRAYEPAMCRWVTSHLQPGDLFVDVGANVGLVSFTAATSGARVAAYEPNPSNCERWHANHALNPEAHGHLTQAAVGDSATTVRFTVERESGWGHVSSDGRIEVPQTTLDNEFPAETIAVLKIDVEGHEPAVLRGARKLLAEGRVRTVVCEINSSASETVAMLATLGYRQQPISRLDSAFIKARSG